MLFSALLLLGTYRFQQGHSATVHNPAVKHVKALYGEKHVGNTFRSDGNLIHGCI